MKLEPNSKVRFAGEKAPYTVKAADGRYAICTKPFNLQRTVLYTIVDQEEQVRGPNDLVFNSYDYKEQKDIERCLRDLKSGKVGISRRNRADLAIIQ